MPNPLPFHKGVCPIPIIARYPLIPYFTFLPHYCMKVGPHCPRLYWYNTKNRCNSDQFFHLLSLLFLIETIRMLCWKADVPKHHLPLLTYCSSAASKFAYFIFWTVPIFNFIQCREKERYVNHCIKQSRFTIPYLPTLKFKEAWKMKDFS